jgi:hypothetical protein
MTVYWRKNDIGLRYTRRRPLSIFAMRGLPPATKEAPAASVWFRLAVRGLPEKLTKYFVAPEFTRIGLR